ncbi:hypothetical protein [Nocardiopsis alborubida]|uniref:Uncharacterized protein n=1 Tax=Nocardiopsis alborubida TaxID=146802 RepID=A0A7X6ME18_9ACTN|nr:hypothetical protein [Nocardiopsis alborubida]NKY99062.1 hypothetical protein [Nocardiopsis alborubida]
MIAWGSAQIYQGVQNQAEIAPGHENPARAVARILDRLPSADLGETENEDARHAAAEILEEATQPEPDQGRTRRAWLLLRGLLSPLARGAESGSQAAAHDWARTAIEQISGMPQIGG